MIKTETLSKHNVAFRSFSENFETATPMGKFALQMMGAVSELERNTIVDNVKMGLKQRARQGKHNGKVPIGYRVTGGIISGSRQRNTRVEIVPEEAEIVRRIFDEFAGGKGYRSIANALNHDGYKTPRGNFFSSETVRSIIDNPFYVGMIRYNQYENWHERRRKGKTESVILQKGEHEPIISQELWDKVRFIRERKEYVGTKRCHVGYLLTGLLRCPDCNGSMVASRTVNWAKSGEKVVRFYYVCGNARNKGKMACKANSILKEKAELYVRRRLQKVLTNNGILKRVVREMNKRMKVRRIPLEKELQGIEQKIEQTEKSKAKYFTLFDNDAIDKEVLARRMEELTTERDQLKHRKYDIEELLQLETTTEQVSADYVKGLLTKLDQLMGNAEFDKKKALLL